MCPVAQVTMRSRCFLGAFLLSSAARAGTRAVNPLLALAIVGWLRQQVREYREERRKGRERMAAEGLPPYRWYDKLVIRGGFVIGVCLLIWGDTVERVLGAVMVGVPTLLWTWAAVSVLREGRWRSED
jgi:hypothetical protein